MNILKSLKLEKLSKRDRYLTAGMFSFILIFALYRILSVLIITPLAQTEKKLAKNSESLKKIQFVKEEYLKINSKLSAFKSKLSNKSFNISSYVVSQLENTKINSKMQNLKPSSNRIGDYQEVAVKFSLVGVTYNEITKFLYQIENSPYKLYIDEIQIKPESYDNLHLLNINLKILTYILSV